MKIRHSCLDLAAYETERFSSLVSILNLLQTYFLDTVTDFFDPFGHQTTYESFGNKHFVTK